MANLRKNDSLEQTDVQDTKLSSRLKKVRKQRLGKRRKNRPSEFSGKQRTITARSFCFNIRYIMSLQIKFNKIFCFLVDYYTQLFKNCKTKDRFFVKYFTFLQFNYYCNPYNTGLSHYKVML